MDNTRGNQPAFMHLNIFCTNKSLDDFTTPLTSMELHLYVGPHCVCFLISQGIQTLMVV